MTERDVGLYESVKAELRVETNNAFATECDGTNIKRAAEARSHSTLNGGAGA